MCEKGNGREMADPQGFTVLPQQGQKLNLVVPVGLLEKASATSPSEAFKNIHLWVLYHIFSKVTNVGISLLGEKGGRVCLLEYRERKELHWLCRSAEKPEAPALPLTYCMRSI